MFAFFIYNELVLNWWTFSSRGLCDFVNFNLLNCTFVAGMFYSTFTFGKPYCNIFYWQLEYVAGSNEEDSDEYIPGLDDDLDNTDPGNVVLVRSKEVGTLPRRQHLVRISVSLFHTLFLSLVM